MKKKKIIIFRIIRIEALIPIALVLSLLTAYVLYFMDSHLRWGLSWVATQIYGAEVNIDAVNTSLKKPSIRLSRLQFTDKKDPKLNIIEVQTINVSLLWDALLRTSIVTDNVSIDGIKAYSKRKKPGYILANDHPSRKMFKKIEDDINNQINEKIEGNFIGDIVKLSKGANATKLLDGIKSGLQTDKHIKSIETQLKEKEKQWKQRIANLPQKKDIDKIVAEAKALRLKGKNVVDSLKTVEKAKSLYSKVQKYIKDYETAKKDLGKDLGNQANLVKEIETLIKKDINDIQSRFNIPKLDPSTISKNIFGQSIKSTLVKVKQYTEMSRKYLPPNVEKKIFEKKANKIPEKDLNAERLTKGKNYRFMTKVSYPKYWIKKAQISSQSNQEFKWSGDLSGVITNFSSHPQSLSKPAQIAIKGNFPYQQINGLDANLILDHRTADPVETFRIYVDKFPVAKKDLIRSPDVDLILQNSNSSITINGSLENQNLKIVSLTEYKENKYSINSKNSLIKELIERALSKIPILNIRTKANGKWDNLDLDFYSNLGDELSRSLKEVFLDKLNEAKKKVDTYVKEQINMAKQKLTREANTAINKALADLSKNGADLKKLESEVKKLTTQGATQSLEKEGKKLLKSLGF